MGVALTGNAAGLTVAGLGELEPAERERLRDEAYATLHTAGPHYVVDGIADVMPVLEAIDERAARGERP